MTKALEVLLNILDALLIPEKKTKRREVKRITRKADAAMIEYSSLRLSVERATPSAKIPITGIFSIVFSNEGKWISETWIKKIKKHKRINKMNISGIKKEDVNKMMKERMQEQPRLMRRR